MQVHSFIEYFEDNCTDPIHWMSAANYFPGFTEGWATYVEYELLPQDTKLYSNTLDKQVLLQKYGMVYYQVITSLCKEALIVDNLLVMTSVKQKGVPVGGRNPTSFPDSLFLSFFPGTRLARVHLDVKNFTVNCEMNII